MRKNNVNKPTEQEKAIATAMQAPTAPAPLATSTDVFNSVSGMRDSQTILGGESANWVTLVEEPNPFFPNGGDFSQPFKVLKASYHVSKTAANKERLIIKCAIMGVKDVVLLSLPYASANGSNAYPDRAALLEAFERDSRPIGILQFQKVDRGQSNPYFRMIYSDENTLTLAGLTPPDQTEKSDGDVPF